MNFCKFNASKIHRMRRNLLTFCKLMCKMDKRKKIKFKFFKDKIVRAILYLHAIASMNGDGL